MPQTRRRIHGRDRPKCRTTEQSSCQGAIHTWFEQPVGDAQVGAVQGEGAPARHPPLVTLLRNALPGSGQAETHAAATAAFDFFVDAYGVKWDKAGAKLAKDRDALLIFYDFPAEHWKQIRTSTRHLGHVNMPCLVTIESTFATVRHRTKRTKGCLSRETGLAMAFKLMMSAQAKWRKLDGRNRLPEVISGVEFRDGVRQLQAAA